MSESPEQFRYDDVVVRKFLFATLVWAVVGMAAGLFIALQLVFPALNVAPYLTFGRLRPLHTNAVIFAFAGNAIFAGVYHSTQRLLKARLFSDALSRFHFWGWQLIIVGAAATLPLGWTQGKEYAELEWPLDILIAVVWIAFAINFFGTIVKRRERHLYVAIWFYIAAIVTIPVLHIFNNLSLPISASKSYSIYAGVQDAFMQWWYGHNAVGFFLTVPFLGIMYYYLPKAAERPVYSYRLSILHFWSLVFIYIWAGPHHLHYTALPEWASTLGMVFSVMLWMPSWGGMINGLFTLRGAWKKVADDPVLKFLVVAITFYGMSTFEGPLMSIKTVNSLSHYTDWTVGHVHGGTLGWNGFLTFGMIYWLAPRLFQTGRMYSKKLMEFHFWTGTIGILAYMVAMYVGGITQGLMWGAANDEGTLEYSFMETVTKIVPYYAVRAVGGGLYLAGVLVGVYNVWMTWRMRPRVYEDKVHLAPALHPAPAPHAAESRGLVGFASVAWHRTWERLPLVFTVAVTITVIVATLFEALPVFLIQSNVPTISTVQPYTPLELYGRDLYVREGCYNCHSQMVRPIRMETERYKSVLAQDGDLSYSKPGEFVYDHPFQWGSKRIGPDLHRVGKRYTDSWHYDHMRDPKSKAEDSVMPRFDHLFERDIDYATIPKRVGAQVKLGVPYTEYERANGEKLARWQADQIAANLRRELADQNRTAEPNLSTKEIIALIAYLQRLGTDAFRESWDHSARPWVDEEWRKRNE